MAHWSARGRSYAVVAVLLFAGISLLALGGPSNARASGTEELFSGSAFQPHPETLLEKAENLAAAESISVAQAEEDLERQVSAGNIAGGLKAKLGDDFAGISFDNKTGEFHVDIAPKTSKGDAEATVADHGASTYTTFDSVAHTWNQLESETDRLRLQISSAIGDTPFEVIPVAATNRPRVELATTASSQDVASVNSTIAGSSFDPELVRVPAEVLKTEAAAECSWPYCRAPIRDGVRINGGEYFCTEGPMARDARGYPYIFTAGHCTEDFGGTWWTKPNEPAKACNIGTPVAGGVSEELDAEVISAPGACGTMFEGMVEWRTPYEAYKIHGVALPYEGLYQCHPGASSVNECGTVEVISSATTIGYKKGAVTVHHLDRLCMVTIPGDSGGAIQYGNTEWTYVTALTIASNGISTSCAGGARTWGYEMVWAEYWIGVKTVKE